MSLERADLKSHTHEDLHLIDQFTPSPNLIVTLYSLDDAKGLLRATRNYCWHSNSSAEPWGRSVQEKAKYWTTQSSILWPSTLGIQSFIRCDPRIWQLT